MTALSDPSRHAAVHHYRAERRIAGAATHRSGADRQGTATHCVAGGARPGASPKMPDATRRSEARVGQIRRPSAASGGARAQGGGRARAPGGGLQRSKPLPLGPQLRQQRHECGGVRGMTEDAGCASLIRPTPHAAPPERSPRRPDKARQRRIRRCRGSERVRARAAGRAAASRYPSARSFASNGMRVSLTCFSVTGPMNLWRITPLASTTKVSGTP